ncbi:hypothetical protein McanMca71_006104 [Microsporum canis]
MAHPQVQPPEVPTEIRESCQRLQENAKKLKALRRLEPRAINLLTAAVKIITVEQSIRASKIYNSFLHDILRTCGQSGPGLVVLCAVSLGKNRVISLSEEKRTMLVSWVTNNQAFLYDSALSSLAAEYGVPDSKKCCGDSADPIALPLTETAVEVLREYMREGKGDQLQILCPDPSIQEPFMLIPFEICTGDTLVADKYADCAFGTVISYDYSRLVVEGPSDKDWIRGKPSTHFRIRISGLV